MVRYFAGHLITSLPDVEELQADGIRAREHYQQWFVDTAAQIMHKVQPDAYAIFYQSDAKVNGVWVDKGHLLCRAAERAGLYLLWHKIACITPPGKAKMGRPSYSHMLCFSKRLNNIQVAQVIIIPTLFQNGANRDLRCVLHRRSGAASATHVSTLRCCQCNTRLESRIRINDPLFY